MQALIPFLRAWHVWVTTKMITKQRAPLEAENTHSCLCACARVRTHTHAHSELSVSWPIDQCWQIADTPGVLIRGPIRTYLHTHAYIWACARTHADTHIQISYFFFLAVGLSHPNPFRNVRRPPWGWWKKIVHLKRRVQTHQTFIFYFSFRMTPFPPNHFAHPFFFIIGKIW